MVAAVGYVAAGIGFGLLVPGITHVAMRNIAGPVAGAASAVLNSSRQLGTAVGLALVGAIGAATTQHTWTNSRFGDTGSGSASIATGNLQGIPAHMQDTARSAFEMGYHVALGVCIASLLLAVGLSLRALKQQTPRTEALRVKEPSL
ncbi:hypothetical protein [Nonomuraea sp. NPDC049695]|uniref:hypothetical protein n=1 Tax=Nonomuraea sp. NPDC049695 TaxID=3154734 RepID=UPI0034264526